MATNFKAEIAEALFDSSVKISREALLWAMSNLPDSENKGEHSVKASKAVSTHDFDHDQESILQAVGVTEEEAQELAGVMADELRKIKNPDSKVSKIVEGVLNAIDRHPNLIKLIVVKQVQDALEFAESASEMKDMAKMMKLMKMLGKMKGGGDEE